MFITAWTRTICDLRAFEGGSTQGLGTRNCEGWSHVFDALFSKTVRPHPVLQRRLSQPMATGRVVSLVAVVLIVAFSHECMSSLPSSVIGGAGPVAPAIDIATAKLLPRFVTNAEATGRDAGITASSVPLSMLLSAAKFDTIDRFHRPPLHEEEQAGEDVMLWLFGDTFVRGGFPMRSSTGAWSRHPQTSPWDIHESIENATYKVPFQFYPFTPDEAQFNEAHRTPPSCCHNQSGCSASEPYCNCGAERQHWSAGAATTTVLTSKGHKADAAQIRQRREAPLTVVDCRVRYAIWPGSAFALNDTHLIGYYNLLMIGAASFDFTSLGVGVALVDANRTVARRVMEPTTSTMGQRPAAAQSAERPLILFNGTEPTFTLAVQHSLRSKHDSVPSGLYVYARSPGIACVCCTNTLLAKVPLTYDEVTSREAYSFFAGVGQGGDSLWSPSLAEAQWVMSLFDIRNGIDSIVRVDAPPPRGRRPPRPFGADESPQSFYLTTSQGICTGGHEADIRWSVTPWGPYSAATTVNMSVVGATTGSYAGAFHQSVLNATWVAAHERVEGGDDIGGKGASSSTLLVRALYSFYQPNGWFDGMIRLVDIVNITIDLSF